MKKKGAPATPKPTHSRNGLSGIITWNGLGSPRPKQTHQEVIIDLASAINIYLMAKGLDGKYKAYPEIELGKANTAAPDVILKDRASNLPVMFVEVEHKELTKTLGKARLAMTAFPTVKEGFVYDYVKNTWLRIAGAASPVQKTSKSSVLNKSLSKLLETSLLDLLKEYFTMEPRKKK